MAGEFSPTPKLAYLNRRENFLNQRAIFSNRRENCLNRQARLLESSRTFLELPSNVLHWLSDRASTDCLQDEPKPDLSAVQTRSLLESIDFPNLQICKVETCKLSNFQTLNGEPS